MSFQSLYFSGVTIFDDEYAWDEDSNADGADTNEEDAKYKTRIAKSFIVDNYIDLLAFLSGLKQGIRKENGLRERRAQLIQKFKYMSAPKLDITTIHKEESLMKLPSSNNLLRTKSSKLLKDVRLRARERTKSEAHIEASTPTSTSPTATVPWNRSVDSHASTPSQGHTMKKLNDLLEFKMRRNPLKKHAKTMQIQADDKILLEEARRQLEEKEQVTAMAAQFGKALLDKNNEMEAEILALKSKLEDYQHRDALIEDIEGENARLKTMCEFLKKQVLYTEDHNVQLLQQGEELAEKLELHREITKKAFGHTKRSLLDLSDIEKLQERLEEAQQNEESLVRQLKKAAKTQRNLEAELERLQEQLIAVQDGGHDTDNLRAKVGSLLQRIKQLEAELSALKFEEQVYEGAGIPKRVAIGALEVLITQCGFEEENPLSVVDVAEHLLAAIKTCVESGAYPSALSWLIGQLKSAGLHVGHSPNGYGQGSQESDIVIEPTTRIAAYLVVAVIALQLASRVPQVDSISTAEFEKLKVSLEEAERALRNAIKARDEKNEYIATLEAELAILRNSTLVSEESAKTFEVKKEELDRAVSELRSENGLLVAKVSALADAMNIIRVEKDSSENTLRSENAKLSSTLTELREEVTNLRAEKQKVEVCASQESNDLARELSAVTRELSDTKRELESAKHHVTCISEMHTKERDTLKTEINTLRVERSNAEEQLRDANKTLERDLTDLRARSEAQQSERAQVVAEVARLREEKSMDMEKFVTEKNEVAAEVNALKSQIVAMQADKEGMQKIIDTLRAELAASTSATAAAEAAAAVAAAEAAAAAAVPVILSPRQQQNNTRIPPPIHRSKDYTYEEEEVLVRYVNSRMKSDSHLWHVLPVDPAAHIIHAVYDGVLLCKLVNFAVPGTLDDRVVNLIPLTSVDVEQNFNLCLNSARAIGCIVRAANATELSQAEESLNLIYELIKVSVLNPLNLSNHPEFSRLKDSRESISQLANLSPIKILERWVSFHLQIHFTFDNSKALTVTQCIALITKLSPHTPTYSDDSERCEWLINTAKFIMDSNTDVLCDDVGTLLTNPRIQVLLLAQIAHRRSGISPLAEPEESAVKTALADNDSDVEGSREERAFSMWINSLGIGLYVTNLQQDTRDGVVLLKILDKIQPGCVNWKDVNMSPNNPYKMLENCNKSLVVGKKLDFTIVSIDGKDLFDGNRKLILAFVWQACKHHLLSVLRGCGGAKGELTENDVLSWAKEKLQRVDKPTIASFRDPALRTARPLLEVLASVAPTVVQWRNVISNPQSDEECLMNARYVVGLARKIGCFVFCLPEDIFDVKPKMIITFLASLMWYDRHHMPSYVKS